MHKNRMTWLRIYAPETRQSKAINGREGNNKVRGSYENLFISLVFKITVGLWPSFVTRKGRRWKGWVTNQPQNLWSTVCPACWVFKSQSLAESSSRRPERLHAATDGSRSRIPPPKFGKSCRGEGGRVLWTRKLRDTMKTPPTESIDQDSLDLQELGRP